MKRNLLLFFVLLCSLATRANLETGTATSRNLFFGITTSDTCVIDTSQANFQTGALTNVELTTSPGDVMLVNSGGEKPDQVSSPAALSTTNNLSATTWTGQTFRANVTGNLTKLTVGLGLASGSSGTITVEIRNVNGVNPGTTVLATSTFGPVSNVGSAAFYTTTFATPAAVVSGTSYSIVLRLSVGSTVFGVRGSTAGGSSLANGSVFTTTNSGTLWTMLTSDLWFNSYVTQPVMYSASGNLISGVKDANPAVGLATVWKTLSWTGITPANTTIQLQAAASNSITGPFNFVGPDGTASTFFTNGASIAQFNGLRYLKYKALLTSAVSSSTPVLNDVSACAGNLQLLTAAISDSTKISCHGSSSGSATVTASGGTSPYTYAWSPSGGTAANTTGLSSNTYTVTVTDANLFTATAHITIAEPPILAATITDSTNVSCNGGSNASATISASGGTGAYTYAWAPSGGTAATATGLSAGTYTVTITDSNFCTITASVIISEPPVLAATISDSTNVSCKGGSNSSATVSASGGTGAYTYAWAPSGGTASTATGLSAGTYTVTITDSNFCTTTASVNITQPPVLTATISDSTNVSCNGGLNGSATIIASGGTGAFTYAWSPSGGTAATATGLSTGSYTATVTDSNFCTTSTSVNITQPQVLTATISDSTNVSCNGGYNGSATVSVSGGTGQYTYSWSPSGGTAAQAQGLTAGNYTCTITDENTCVSTRDIMISEPSAITATTSQTNVTCSGAATGMATAVAIGGSGTKSYLWSPEGGTDTTAKNLTAGNYTCTITDENSCTIVENFSITAPSSTPGSTNYSLPTSNQIVVSNTADTNFIQGTCELISIVDASGTSPVSGTITSKVWVEDTVPTFNGIPFVQRHYEITPANNPSTSTGNVTIYFTQAEFDNFNAQPASTLHLPATASDEVGKANLRISKYSGVSTDGTGLPSSYSSGITVVDPDDSQIIWNAVSGTWEVTFAVNGFSGFIAQTELTALPVSWLSFTVKYLNGSVILNWNTGPAQNIKNFIVQYSTDGINWKPAGVVGSAGYSTGQYSYVHVNAVKEYNYYRIMQTALTGEITYSEIRTIKLSRDSAPFIIAGNKIINGMLNIQVHETMAFSLYNLNGKRLWIKRFIPGMQSVDVSKYAKGIYILKAQENTQKIVIQ